MLLSDFLDSRSLLKTCRDRFPGNDGLIPSLRPISEGKGEGRVGEGKKEILIDYSRQLIKKS